LAADSWRGLDFLAIVETEQAGLDPSRSFRSSPSGDRYLSQMLSKLRIDTGEKILDVGCGKGNAMRRMLHFPFVHVDGVELSPALAAIADRNFTRLKSRRTTVFVADAAEFQSYGDYDFIYFYNPFPASVMRQVLHSIGEQPPGGKEVIIIYNNPTCQAIVTDAGFSHLRTFPDRWGNGIAVYSSVPASQTTRLL
jgi:protein-L-isoaspartate O-methyltransferase